MAALPGLQPGRSARSSGRMVLVLDIVAPVLAGAARPHGRCGSATRLASARYGALDRFAVC
jgi:hypothetical protein